MQQKYSVYIDLSFVTSKKEVVLYDFMQYILQYNEREKNHALFVLELYIKQHWSTIPLKYQDINNWHI